MADELQGLAHSVTLRKSDGSYFGSFLFSSFQYTFPLSPCPPPPRVHALAPFALLHRAGYKHLTNSALERELRFHHRRDDCSSQNELPVLDTADASELRSSWSSSPSSPDSDERELLAKRALERIFGTAPPTSCASSPFASSHMSYSSVGHSGGGVGGGVGGTSTPHDPSTSTITCPSVQVHDLVAFGETTTGKTTEIGSGLSAFRLGQGMGEVENVPRPGCARPDNRRTARRRSARMGTAERHDTGGVVVAGKSGGRRRNMQSGTLSNLSQGSGSNEIEGRHRGDGGKGPRGRVVSAAGEGGVRPRQQQQPPHHHVGASGVVRWGPPEMVRSV